MAEKKKRQPIDPRVPRREQLLQPTFHALKVMGGSGNNEEIVNQIIKDLNITNEVASILHTDSKKKTELSYQADWARTYLKNGGVIERTGRTKWAIRPEYVGVNTIDEKAILEKVTALSKAKQDKDKKESTDNSKDPETANTRLQDEGKPRVTVNASTKETIQIIKNYIAAKGFSYEDGLIENFYLSLKSKPFVILAGTSGTGKTRLVKLFAEAIGATDANGRYKMVSVRPDWSDSTDLFGHVDLNGHYIPGAITDFVKNAQNDIDNPYILCLDEMNLARVEYYLSDFLSVVETRDFDDQGRIETVPLVSENYYGSDRDAAKKYGKIILPENLYVVGTVNMDETTFPFSKKVLDRANTIEFSYVDLTPQVVTEQKVSALNLSNQFLKTKYLILQQCQAEADAVEQYCAELKSINDKLKNANAHVGYRIRDEIVFYMLNNKEENLIPENDAFDNELLQKVLPRIQGSSASIKKMLCDLFEFCAGNYERYQTETNISAKMRKAAKEPDCKYKKSAEKIAFMVGRYEEDGFTSYWL